MTLLSISIFSVELSAQSWTIVIPQDTIKNWVLQEIQRHFSQNKNIAYQIESVQAPQQIQLPSKQYNYVIENKQNRWRGNVVFTIRIVSPDDRRIWKTFTAYAKIKTIGKVVVAKTLIRKGTVITRDLVTLKNKETTKLKNGYFSSVADVVGKRAVQTIRKNQIIYSRYIRKVPIIKRGERIVLMYNKPPLIIKVYAIALQDGGPGEWIWVKNLQSNKRLKAKVVRAGIAEVE